MIYFLTKNIDRYNFSNVKVTNDEETCLAMLNSLLFMGYDKEATSLNTILARELLDSWGNDELQVVVDKTTIPNFGQQIADKYLLHGFNIKYDHTLAKANGLTLRRVKDAMLVEQRLGLGSGRPNNLLATYERRTGKKFPTQKQTRTEFVNWPRGQLFEEYHIIYSAYDVQVLPEIITVQDDLVKKADMEFLMNGIEHRLCPILGNMELEGMKLNDAKWLTLVQDNTKLKAQSELKLDAILEQMKPVYPVLNSYTFKRTFAEQTSLFHESKDAGVKTFNYSSSPALLKLFIAAGLPVPKGMKKDLILKKKVLKPSIAEDTLKEYLIKYPKTPFKIFIEELIIYKKLEKRLNSFGARFLSSELRTKSSMKIGYKNPKTSKVHTTYRQCMTATGRLASGDEENGFYNSQQLPKDNRYRNCFTISDEEIQAGWKVCTLDLSGAELIIAASLSGEVKIFQMKDIHSTLATAAYRRVLKYIMETASSKEEAISNIKILLTNTKLICTQEEAEEAYNNPSGYTISRETKFREEIRDDFKRVIYGLLYGATASRISEVLNVPQKWAEIVESTLREELPILFKYLDDNSHKAKTEGFVKFNNRTNSRHIFKSYLEAAQYGRNLTILEASQIERNAKNYPIQGTQADMMKESIVEIHDQIDHDRYVLLLQVHDEIVFKFLGEDIVKQVEKIVTSTCDRYLADNVHMGCAYHINDYWEK